MTFDVGYLNLHLKRSNIRVWSTAPHFDPGEPTKIIIACTIHKQYITIDCPENLTLHQMQDHLDKFICNECQTESPVIQSRWPEGAEL